MQTVTRTKAGRRTRKADPEIVKELIKNLKTLSADSMIQMDGTFTTEGRARSHASLYRTALKDQGVNVKATAYAAVSPDGEDIFVAAIYGA